MAVGLSVAQQIMRDQGGPQGNPAIDLLSPADAAKALGVTEADVMATIESGQLSAKKIGSAYRIKRSDLQEYLNK
jgi:excisionase family DNA binding protein